MKNNYNNYGNITDGYNLGKFKFHAWTVNKVFRLNQNLKRDEKIKVVHGAIIEICKKSKIEMFFDKIKNKILRRKNDS